MKYIRTTAATVLALTLSAGVGTAAYAAPVISGTAQPAAAVAAASADLASARATILAETNAARAAAGLAPLAEDADLDRVAQGCSEQQAANGTMAHCEGFSSRFPSGWTRAAENVASGQSVDDVVDAWLGSPGHRANILDASSTHIGIGFALGADGRTYFTQNFASYPAGSRPAPAPTEQPVEPAPAPAAPEPAAPAQPEPAEPAPAEPAAPAPEAPSEPSAPERPEPEAPVTTPSAPEERATEPDASSILGFLWSQLRASGSSWFGSALK